MPATTNKSRRKRIGDALAAVGSFMIRLLCVPKCVLCGDPLADDGEICPECAKIWKTARLRRCPVCARTARACSCRPMNMDRSLDTLTEDNRSVSSLVFYPKRDPDAEQQFPELAVRRVIGCLKRSPDRSAEIMAARELAECVLRLLIDAGEKPEEWCITYPPRRASERRKYGFDQAKGLARRISRYSGLKFENCFLRHGGEMQKTLNSMERRENAEHIYTLKGGCVPKDKKYIIADDVITTGATVSALAGLLKEAGALKVYPVSVARTKTKKRRVRRAEPSRRPWFIYRESDK